jgi:hypothetical protein
MDGSAIRAVLAAGVVVFLGGCATTAPVQRTAEYLDDATGATVTRVEESFLFFSDDPARAANARDYMQAAPLAVNQGGKRSWWLWLGQWSTIDRGISVGDAELPGIAAVQVIVDGEPMDLDMSGRTDRIPAVTRLPYAAPVATARNMVLPLTGSQVVRLSRGNRIVIRTEMTSGPALNWQPWIGRGNWTNFAEIAAAVPGSDR